jgi:hypothetical protein
MSFKKYLNEEVSVNTNRILLFIKDGRIPISPKFWEENVGVKEGYCFQSMEPDRLSSLFKRQGKKNQVSAFIHFKSPVIFWGAEGLSWYGLKGNSLTVVAILKGKMTVHGELDLFTSFDGQGRRWVDVRGLNMLNTADTNTQKFFKLVQYDVRQQFEIWLTKEYDLDYKNIFLSSFSDLSNKTLNKIIKKYFDLSYEAIKRRLPILKYEKMFFEYDEVLCYNYKVEKLLFIYERGDNEAIEDAESLKEKYKSKTKIEIVNPKEAEKILKQYQKKNKGKK